MKEISPITEEEELFLEHIRTSIEDVREMVEREQPFQAYRRFEKIVARLRKITRLDEA